MHIAPKVAISHVTKAEAELDSVVESISFGKTFHYKKLTFQAFSAAIQNTDQVRFVLNYLGNVNNLVHARFPSAKNKIIAYRVNNQHSDQMVRGVQSQDVTDRILSEGFDDDGEAGAGEKLMGLLQKMEVENIMVIVCIWSSGATLGTMQVRGGELYKVILDRAKELLNTIHEQILATQQEIKRQNEVEWQNSQNTSIQGRRKVLGSKIFHMGSQSPVASQTTRGGEGSAVELNRTGAIRKPSPFKTSAILTKFTSVRFNRSRSPGSPRMETIQDSLMMNQSQLNS